MSRRAISKERKKPGDVRLPFERPPKGKRAGVLELNDFGGIVKLQGLVFGRCAGGSRTRQQRF